MLDSCCQGMVSPEAASLDLAVLFSTGFMISLGHCVGMCGPIAVAYSMARRDAGVNRARLAPSLFIYHGGRLTSYMLIGAVLALIGSATSWLGTGSILPGSLSIVAGLLMVLLGLGLWGILPVGRWIEGGPLSRPVTCGMASLLRAESRPRQFGLGIANGFLPCGPVAAVAIGSMTAGSIVRGASAMLAFGLGTVPVMLAVGLGASLLGAGTRHRLFRLGTILLALVGVQLALRGMSAFGWVGHLKVGGLVFW